MLKMSKKLTLDERYHISMYARRLPCTLPLRFAIDKFFNQIEIIPEEMEKYGIEVNTETREFICNDDEYTVEYKEFPPEVVKAMDEYIKMYSHEDNDNNEMLQKTFNYFNLIIKVDD